ncbi:mitochondrial import inner membrane translocase subunit TIM50-like [Styela clava]
MAGRVWTKGIAWKKTAIKILGESHTFPTQNYEEKAFFNATPTSFLASMSQDKIVKSPFSSLSFSRKSYPGSHFLPNRGGDNLTESLYKFSMTSSVGNRLCGIRAYSTSDNSHKPTDSETPKVNIISSMFDGEQKKAKFEEKEEESKSEDKEEDKDKESPFMRSQRYAKWSLLATFIIGTPTLIYHFGPPKHDEMGNIIEDEFSKDPLPLAYLKRAWGEIKLVEKDIVEPSSQKLLPDPLREPYYQPPYTLVIELFDVLLHPVYDQVTGWRFKKRPGIDYFLATVGPPLYEIVIFTRETGMTAYPLIDSMDPKGYIMYRLFRDAARFKSGFKSGSLKDKELPKLDPYYQKDITYLNRDLKRVVVVDNDKRATELQPSNGITLKPWDGSNTDTELFDLAAFLHTLASNEVDDVRPVLEHYRKFEDPLAQFKLAQIRMREEQIRLEKELQENKNKPFMMNSGKGGFSMLTNYFRPRKT